MPLPAGYKPSRYVGVLEAVTVFEKPLFSKKQLRMWKHMHGWELSNRIVRVFRGRLKTGKYVHSSPILRIDPCPDDSGHKTILVENGNWYRAELVLESAPVNLRADGQFVDAYKQEGESHA